MSSKCDRWTRDYRCAATSDSYRVLARWLEDRGWVDAEDLAAKAVDETIHLVERVVFRGDTAGMLPLQVYDPAQARTRYVLTFQGGAHDLARLYVDDLCKQCDLAEIFDEGVGFQVMTIDLVGRGHFRPGERKRLEAAVRMDFDYDYLPGEIRFGFHRGANFLQVHVSCAHRMLEHPRRQRHVARRGGSECPH